MHCLGFWGRTVRRAGPGPASAGVAWRRPLPRRPPAQPRCASSPAAPWQRCPVPSWRCRRWACQRSRLQRLICLEQIQPCVQIRETLGPLVLCLTLHGSAWAALPGPCWRRRWAHAHASVQVHTCLCSCRRETPKLSLHRLTDAARLIPGRAQVGHTRLSGRRAGGGLQAQGLGCLAARAELAPRRREVVLQHGASQVLPATKRCRSAPRVQLMHGCPRQAHTPVLHSGAQAAALGG